MSEQDIQKKFQKYKHVFPHSWDDILKKIQQGTSFTTIGKELGLSRQRVSQLFYRWFFPVVGKTGLELRFVRKERRHLQKLHKVWVSKVVCQRAQAAGLSVKPVGKRYRAVQIGSHLCYILYSSLPVSLQHGKQMYFRFTCRAHSLQKYDFLIAVCKLKKQVRCFILPVYLIQSKLATIKTGQYECYIPVFPVSTDNLRHRKPSIDYFEYLERWDLLKEEEKSICAGEVGTNTATE
ncbi:MAG: hypothetical protein QXQ02_03675 [Halobacteria archaeon]